jgi:DNA-binding GntR family transcriptional regulator
MVDLAEKLKGKQIKTQVLTEQVSQILTEAILDGTLGPGESLIETDLQKQLGVSRSPLREGFRDLEKKGLVTIIPRRGTFVREITRKDVEENFPVRATLEGLAARQAYPRITPDQLSEMASALEGMKRVGQTGDSENYRKNHLKFHEVFIMASGNTLLIDILKTLRVHRLWYLVSFRYHHRNFEFALAEHQEILDLFSSPKTDPQVLERVVRSHIEEALEKLFGTPEKKL